MRKYLFVALTALMSVGGAYAASPVAVCEAGFAIKTLPGNRAACAKTENVADDLGPRKCALDGRRVSAEAADGGDLCQGTASAVNSLLVGPAKDCKLDYGPSARNQLVRGRADRCIKIVSRETRGGISVRNE